MPKKHNQQEYKNVHVLEQSCIWIQNYVAVLEAKCKLFPFLDLFQHDVEKLAIHAYSQELILHAIRFHYPNMKEELFTSLKKSKKVFEQFVGCLEQKQAENTK